MKNISLNKLFFVSCLTLVLGFIFIISPHAQQTIVNYADIFKLPESMLKPSPHYSPALIKGMIIYPEKPLRFDFIVDRGQSQLSEEEFEAESKKLVKYFLASLTIPKEQQWVNLSPYEKNIVITNSLGKTDLGTDLLAMDYILKQITAAIIYPEDDLGKEFWDKVYKKAYEEYGTTDIPIDTFNKVWIMPEKATVFQNEDRVFVVDTSLKVMLEQDYLAAQQLNSKDFNAEPTEDKLIKETLSEPLAEEMSKKSIATKIIRDLIIPEIEKEVNYGKNFANMRQIYNSLILGKWYEQALKQSILAKIYVDKNKLKGIDLTDPDIVEKIYQKYMDAYLKGAYNYIREDYDPKKQTVIQKKYFSGGFRNIFDITYVPNTQATANRFAKPVDVVRVALVPNLESIDGAMTAEEQIQKIINKADIPGGVDMDNINLRVRGDDITFEISTQDIQQIIKDEITGFSPDIIDIIQVQDGSRLLDANVNPEDLVSIQE